MSAACECSPQFAAQLPVKRGHFPRVPKLESVPPLWRPEAQPAPPASAGRMRQEAALQGEGDLQGRGPFLSSHEGTGFRLDLSKPWDAGGRPGLPLGTREDVS